MRSQLVTAGPVASLYTVGVSYASAGAQQGLSDGKNANSGYWTDR